MDRDRAGARNDHRRSAGPSRHDGSSATDGAEPRVWSVVCHAGGHVGVLPARAGCTAIRDGRAFTGGYSRSADVHGQLDGCGKIAGSAAAAADYLQGPEPGESGDAGGCHRHCGDAGDASGEDVLVPGDDHYSVDFWGDDDHSDWRRGHANGDFAVEFLRGTFGSGNGIRARKQAADHRRGARWRIRFHSLREHVEGHEPFVHECAVWCVRPGTANRGGRQGSAAGAERVAGRSGGNFGGSEQSGNCAGLRHGRGAGATQGTRTLRRADEAGRRREVRHTPGGRTHARTHECAARRGRHSV